VICVLGLWNTDQVKGQSSRSQHAMTRKTCEHLISKSSEGNLINFGHRCMWVRRSAD